MFSNFCIGRITICCFLILLACAVVKGYTRPGYVPCSFNTDLECYSSTPRNDPDKLYQLILKNAELGMYHNRTLYQFTDKVLFKEYCEKKGIPTVNAGCV